MAASDIRYEPKAEAANVTFSADALAKQNRNQGDVPAQSNYVGFKVTVDYGTGTTNTVNNVVLRAASYIDLKPTDPAIASATYADVANIGDGKAATCRTVTPPANWWSPDAGSSYYTFAAGTYIECSIGQLKPGDRSEFIVYFNVPKAPEGATSGSFPIQFLSRLSYAEGTNDSTGASRTDTQEFRPQPFTTLGFGVNNDPTKASTSVPPNKSVALYTGLGVARPLDPITTIIQIDSTNTTATKAQIEEGFRTGPCTTATTCVRSDITIEGFSTIPTKPLIITLRRDASTILDTSAKIKDAKLYYYPDPLGAYYEEIRVCAGGPLNGDVILGVTINPQNPPETLKRCIWDRKEYGNSAQLGEFRRALLKFEWVSGHAG
jgi:hypothetical protein